MGFQTATLTSGQYTKLRGNHSAEWHAVLCPNTVVFACRVNQASFDTSFASFAFDGVTTGAYTDVKKDWTVYLSHTSDIHDYYYRGRVRKVPASNTFYIDQNSSAISDNDYVFVTKDLSLNQKIPFKSGDDFLFDYDISFREVLPVITNLPTAVVGKLPTGGGNVDFAFTPSALAGASGATISSWSWDSDGGSFASGSSSTQNVTIRFTSVGWRELRVTVTDSGGRTNYRAIKCIVYPEDFSSIVADNLICQPIRCDSKNGWNTSFVINGGTDMVNVLPETEVVVFAEDDFAGTAGSILSNIKFVGRLRRDETDQTVDPRAWLTSGSQIEAEGITAQMSRLTLVSLAFYRKAAPARMGDVKNLTLWRAMQLLFTEFSTISNVCSINYDSTNDDYSVPLYGTNDSPAADAIADAAYAINAFMNAAPSGEFFIARHMWYLNSTDKAALQTNAHWTSLDRMGKVTITREHVDQVGRVIAFGGSFNTSSEDILVLRAKAPAEIFGRGTGRNQVNRQVLKANLTLEESQEEMRVRTGAEYASKNLRTKVTVTHPSGYDNVLIPTGHQSYTMDISADDNVVGFECDNTKKWWLESVNIAYDAERFLTVTTAVYVEDITGVNAQIVAEIAPDDLPVPYPSLPLMSDAFLPPLASLFSPTGETVDPDDEQPFTPEEVQSVRKPPTKTTDPEQVSKPPTQTEQEGSVVLLWNAGGVWITENFTRSGSPVWKNITPASGIKRAAFNEFTGGLYALSYGDPDSYVWRADNALNPAWAAGTLAGKEFSQLAVRNASSVLYALSRTPGSGSYEDALTTGLGIKSHEVGASYPVAIFNGTSPSRDGTSAGTWISTEGNGGGGSIQGTLVNAGGNGLAGIVIDLGALNTILSVSFDYKYKPSSPGSALTFVTFYGTSLAPADRTENSLVASGGANTYHTNTWSGTQTGVRYVVIQNLCNQSPATTAYLDNIVITYLDPGGGVVTRYSTDGGATWATELTVGDDPGGASGFASAPGGSAVYVGVDEKVRQATSGGTYSDTTGGGTTGTYPIAIAPYGSGNFYMASGATISSETLWRVVSGTATAITPNDGSNDGLVVGPGALCISPTDDQCVFAICNFGGTLKLARSTNGGTSWAITTGLASGASWVAAKNNNQVYIANGSSILYSEDGGATLVTKVAPGTSLLGIAVK